MTPAVAFRREGRTIIGQVYSRTVELLDGKYQEVLFCKDGNGSRYRVPKSEVLVMGRKKEARKKARARR